MKIVARIFGIISILVALLFCGLSIHVTERDKNDTIEEMAQAQKQLDEFQTQINTTTGETKAFLEGEMAKAQKIVADAPQPSTYLIIEIFLGVLILLALTFGVLLFGKNPKLVMQLAAAAVLVTLVTYFASPDVERGITGGMTNKALALTSGIPVVIAGLWALLAAKKSASAKVAVA